MPTPTPPTTTTYDIAGSHTWTWPDGETTALVQCWGAGAGGGLTYEDYGAGGGGAGAYARSIVTKSGTATTLEATVGAGGGPTEDGEDSFVTMDALSVASADGGHTSDESPDRQGGVGGIGDSGFGGTLGTNAAHYGGGGGDNISGIFFIAKKGGGGGGAAAGQNCDGQSGTPPTSLGPGGGGVGRMKGGSGGLGGKGIDDTPAEDGADGGAPGGGGGGGGQGKTSGSGKPGMVKITCPAPRHGSDCCCVDCSDSTREDFGLPDTVDFDFDLGTVGSEGMPADSLTNFGCEGEHAYYRWTNSSPLAGLLRGAWEFVERDGCCFRYRSLGDYDPPECGYFATGQRMVANPYPVSAIGSFVSTSKWVGTCKGGPGWWGATLCDTTPVPPPPCNDFCGGPNTQVSEGEIFVPLPIFGSGDLAICIYGNIVTISASISARIPCRVYSGNVNYGPGQAGVDVCIYPGPGDPWSSTPPPDPYMTRICAGDAYCYELPDFTPCGDLTSCSVSGGGVGWHASADLSAVSGATMWDKIKSYPWVGSYIEQSCSCSSGGCVDGSGDLTCECRACVPATCFCTGYTPGTDDVCAGTSVEDPTVVDVPCIFATTDSPMSFVTSYNCVDGNCVRLLDDSGAYATLGECEAACAPPPPTNSFNCVSGTCTPLTDGSGDYPTLIDCLIAACAQPPVTYDCVGGDGGGCVDPQDGTGTYATLGDCTGTGCGAPTCDSLDGCSELRLVAEIRDLANCTSGTSHLYWAIANRVYFLTLITTVGTNRVFRVSFVPTTGGTPGGEPITGDLTDEDTRGPLWASDGSGGVHSEDYLYAVEIVTDCADGNVTITGVTFYTQNSFWTDPDDPTLGFTGTDSNALGDISSTLYSTAGNCKTTSSMMTIFDYTSCLGAGLKYYVIGSIGL